MADLWKKSIIDGQVYIYLSYQHIVLALLFKWSRIRWLLLVPIIATLVSATFFYHLCFCKSLFTLTQHGMWSVLLNYGKSYYYLSINSFFMIFWLHHRFTRSSRDFFQWLGLVQVIIAFVRSCVQQPCCV